MHPVVAIPTYYVRLTLDPSRFTRAEFEYDVTNVSRGAFVCFLESYGCRANSLSKLTEICEDSLRKGKPAYQGHILPPKGELTLKGFVELRENSQPQESTEWSYEPHDAEETHLLTLHVVMVRLHKGNALGQTHYIKRVTLHITMPGGFEKHTHKLFVTLPGASFSTPIQAPQIIPHLMLHDPREPGATPDQIFGRKSVLEGIDPVAQ
jgi:hypothetical protein